MRVAILGRTQMLYDTMEALKKAGHEIVIIGTCKAAPEYEIDEHGFEKKAEEMQVPFFCNANLTLPNIVDLLKASKPDIAVSINWLTIIQEQTMALFPYGILNGHPGDLPRYRGNASPNWAIINGEEKIGVAVHFMEAGSLDSGDIVVKESIDVSPHTTVGEIYKQLDTLFPKMFVQAIDKIERMGKKAGTAQSKKREDVLRGYPRIPSDSCIDWNSDCLAIDRLIRASGQPFQDAYTFLNGKEKIYIQEADITEYEFPSLVVCGQVVIRDCENDCVGIAAKDGVIMIRKIRDDNHQQCRVTEKIRSMRDRMGMDIPDKIYELMKEIEFLKREIGRDGYQS
ncbi:MAG: hypothetical protein HFI53_00650 [Lachnospiraceae bacterium]|nr:hypothetical protein [Lachnospiraceae bacterium]